MKKKRGSAAAAKEHGPPRIVLTGGPGGGKTAIASVLQRQYSGEVIVVPESATILFTGGFPRGSEAEQRRRTQRAIFAVQRELEEIVALSHPQLPQVCDRGSLDGACYWPGGLQSFLRAMDTTLDAELARYDAVIFMQSSAHEETSYSPENPCRIETPAEARRLDTRLQKVWENHPDFHLIGHRKQFYEKVVEVLRCLERVIEQNSKPTTRKKATRKQKA